MGLRSHVVTFDGGLAPNPFHGYCTSAVCTPSHTNARLKEKDWLIGHSSKGDGNRLVYAMRISEILRMNQYFDDERFERKKPKMDGKPEQQCGDNIYYQNADGRWQRLPSPFHNDTRSLEQDPAHLVFIAKHFYYFGDKRVSFPPELEGVICGGQGTRIKDHLADVFVAWLEANYEPGVLGMPLDMRDYTGTDSAAHAALDAICRPKSGSNCEPRLRSFRQTPGRKDGC